MGMFDKAKNQTAPTKAASAKGAKAGAKDKGPTIGSTVRAAMKAGKTNEQAFEEVKKNFENCKTTLSSVSWYRNSMRQAGEKVPTAREAKAKQEKSAA